MIVLETFHLLEPAMTKGLPRGETRDEIARLAADIAGLSIADTAVA